MLLHLRPLTQYSQYNPQLYTLSWRFYSWSKPFGGYTEIRKTLTEKSTRGGQIDILGAGAAAETSYTEFNVLYEASSKEKCTIEHKATPIEAQICIAFRKRWIYPSMSTRL